VACMAWLPRGSVQGARVTSPQSTWQCRSAKSDGGPKFVEGAVDGTEPLKPIAQTLL
jgi:hypothetical protein